MAFPKQLFRHFLAPGWLILASLSPLALAGPELSGGTWWVYQYTLESDFSGAASSAFDEDLDAETGGNFADPAFVLYATDDGSHGPWHFQSELRVGTGAFTSPAVNNTGDNFAVHKAWIGYDLNEDHTIRLGKSQVPFGWKTSNFWPGDLLQAGYGDQMDVGLKLTGERTRWSYDLAWYQQDDWGETSVDTVDDNGHWGTSHDFDPDGVAGSGDEFTSVTYRKVKTGVVNADFEFMTGNIIGASWQQGRMQDLGPRDPKLQNDEGSHKALDIHYYLEVGDFVGKYRYIDAERDFGDMDFLMASSAAPVDDIVKTSRHAAHLGYNLRENLYGYIEASTAETDTEGNNAEQVESYAPGLRYNYGPGWIYLEYLWQNGDIDANGDVYEADFRTIYASFDFYF